MDFRRKFEFGLAWRTILFVGAVLLVAKALSTPGVRAGLIVAFLIALAAFASLWNFIRRTNFLVSRFIESVRFEDYSQRFSDPSGGGFDVLGQTLDHALKTLQARHADESAEVRYLSGIVDDAPSALLAVGEDGRVEVLNKAARQLFARLPLNRVSDLEALGPELSAAARLPAGTRKSRIEVRDNGAGIPEDRREDIFLPFYTTHKGGSGVGLSFSKQVALAHGGSICALTAQEGGANIRMVI
ncbi:MAG: ATP-binding protein [Bacillota bacterium]